MYINLVMENDSLVAISNSEKIYRKMLSRLSENHKRVDVSLKFISDKSSLTVYGNPLLVHQFSDEYSAVLKILFYGLPVRRRYCKTEEKPKKNEKGSMYTSLDRL